MAKNVCISDHPTFHIMYSQFASYHSIRFVTAAKPLSIETPAATWCTRHFGSISQRPAHTTCMFRVPTLAASNSIRPHNVSSSRSGPLPALPACMLCVCMSKFLFKMNGCGIIFVGSQIPYIVIWEKCCCCRRCHRLMAMAHTNNKLSQVNFASWL